ncbi:putative transcription factor [Podospora fimiseda]|uniref:Transcription factor n=1 Tax=Podospora fimiseda TaxID=252190 RepID=A0AAN6YRA9_9PEZI|nr:putative transcription factor [Podospora fimiseda]
MDPSTSVTDATITTTTSSVVEKRYHAKRPHRKSRKGCRNCKARKVKCDEKRPSCRSCVARNDTCVYPVLPLNTTTTTTTTAISSPSSSSSSSPSPQSLFQEPLFIPTDRDEVDMRLLWFYTNATFNCFSSGPWKERNVDQVLRVDVVQHAFSHPFLMNCLLGLSAMHINQLEFHDLKVPPSKELLYRVKAYEGFRKAVEAADPSSFPALLACSLLLCGLSTYVFRSDEPRSLYVLDWITLWRGIGAIVDMAGRDKLAESGLLPLVIRPNIDMEQSAVHIPSNLVFMLVSIKEGDPDYQYLESYRLALKILGSLYRELNLNGFGPMLLLRIATYFTFLDRQFHDAARKKRPPALMILAHYLAFTNFNDERCWWMEGIGYKEIPNIYSYLSAEWRPFMQVPMMTVNLKSKVEIARLLLNNPLWVSSYETAAAVAVVIKKEEDGTPPPGPGCFDVLLAPSRLNTFDLKTLGEECVKIERDVIVELTEGEQD